MQIWLIRLTLDDEQQRLCLFSLNFSQFISASVSIVSLIQLNKQSCVKGLFFNLDLIGRKKKKQSKRIVSFCY